MFFVALESRNSRACSLSSVQRNGTRLLSGHWRGHIYLFYGTKCTGAFSNIPDACCTAFYHPNTNGILPTAPREQPKSCNPLCLLLSPNLYSLFSCMHLITLKIHWLSLCLGVLWDRWMLLCRLIDCRSQLVTKGNLYCQCPHTMEHSGYCNQAGYIISIF